MRRRPVKATEVVRMLNAKNWDRYWQGVLDQVAEEVTEYRRARAKSLVTSQRRVMA